MIKYNQDRRDSMRKMSILLAVIILALTACGGETETVTPETQEVEKKTEMLDSGVSYYLELMTSKFSSAYTVALTKEDRNRFLNEAITDINIATQEIEDEYEEGIPPTDELFELAETLKILIDADIIGDQERISEYSHKAGVITGGLSDEYLNGELPKGIKAMIEQD